MSTLRVDAIRHNSATSDAITMASDGTCTAKITGITGGGTYSNRNKIINGDFTIHQRGGTIASTSGNYTIDRWRTYRAGGASGGFSVQQSLSSYPQTNISGVIDNFKSSALITVTSAGSADANNNCKFQQRIEGSNVYDLAFGTAVAKKVTVSFYVKCSLTGDFGVALVNESHNRSNVQLYTVNSASTCEMKLITFDGYTSVSWDFCTGTGLQLMFDMGSGSDKHTSSLNTWVSGEKHGTSSSVKLIHTNGATMQYAGVQLEEGSVATSFEHRNYQDELTRCYRYYYRLTGENNKTYMIGMSDNDNVNIYGFFHFPVPMRAVMSTVEQSGNASDYKVRRDTTQTCTGVPSLTDAWYFYARVNFPRSGHGWGTGQMLWCQGGSSSSYLGFSAEL